MRSSYYSDRRFKRGSLAHELCSKIEVTIEKEATSSTRVLFPLPSPPSSSSLSSPRLFPPSASLSAFAHTASSSSCFCFDDIFSLRKRALPPVSPPPLPSPHRRRRFSISRFNPVRSAEGNSQNLLLGISWIIINAYAVAGGIDRRVVLLLFLVLLPLLLLLVIILLCRYRWLPIRPFGKTMA